MSVAEDIEQDENPLLTGWFHWSVITFTDRILSCLCLKAESNPFNGFPVSRAWRGDGVASVHTCAGGKGYG